MFFSEANLFVYRMNTEVDEMNFKHGQTQLKHLKCINTVVFYWVISHEKLCKRNLQTDLCDNEILVINVIAVSTSN